MLYVRCLDTTIEQVTEISVCDKNRPDETVSFRTDAAQLAHPADANTDVRQLLDTAKIGA